MIKGLLPPLRSLYFNSWEISLRGLKPEHSADKGTPGPLLPCSRVRSHLRQLISAPARIFIERKIIKIIIPKSIKARRLNVLKSRERLRWINLTIYGAPEMRKWNKGVRIVGGEKEILVYFWGKINESDQQEDRTSR